MLMVFLDLHKNLMRLYQAERAQKHHSPLTPCEEEGKTERETLGSSTKQQSQSPEIGILAHQVYVLLQEAILSSQ